jgi:dihydrofolate reductase
VKIILIAALSRNRVIGRSGAVPWHYPADMKHFRRATMGHPILAGRKTYESFPRRPLPGRLNLVLTRNPNYPVTQGALVCRSLEEAREICRQRGAEKLFVVGGAQVYELALPMADELLLTHVPQDVEGDTFFPEWDPGEWQEVERRQAEGLVFAKYQRR